MFQFKQFAITQDQSAMKVGTDGVLLGAWCDVKNKQTILDIGTGTGLIALMLAQRNSTAFIDAVEVEEIACKEASINFHQSKWAKQLQVHHTSLALFVTDKKYDLIVSNPPYYTDGFSSANKKRTLARHVGDLTFEKLLQHSKALLSEDGTCAYIVPFKEEYYFIDLAKKNGLFVKKITRVKGRKDLPYKRSLVCLSKMDGKTFEEELVIEVERHVYTEAYQQLTKDFYLKM